MKTLPFLLPSTDNQLLLVVFLRFDDLVADVGFFGVLLLDERFTGCLELLGFIVTPFNELVRLLVIAAGRRKFILGNWCC
jgi:hypothetical protein